MACPRLRLPLLAAVLFLAAFAGGASAADFPEIKPSERALTRVPEFPNAPAVVLFRKGDVGERILPRVDSYFGTVQVRLKILTEEGKRYGEISIRHGKHIQLIGFKGRTVLPDGREIRLPKKAVFKRTLSKNGKQFVTSFALPQVQVGAILDYRYEYRTSSFDRVGPWSFQEEDLPTLHSEMLYGIPSWLQVRVALFDPLELGIKQHFSPEGGLWVWARNLPPILKEPYGPPAADLTSRFLLIPVEATYTEPDKKEEIFKTWASTCALAAPDYEKALGQAVETGKKAREIAASAGGQREKAAAVYRFVRDGIETTQEYGVAIPEGSTADSVLAARRGSYAEKAVLLEALLGALDVPARLVWVGERDSGTIRMDIITPWWFERAIVAAEIDGQRVFLDPSDRSLAFGRLAPGLEGMPALVFDRANPEPVTLPSSPFEENLRKATVELDLDAQGRLSGRGSLRFTGHQAWKRLGLEEAARAWQEWLAGEYTDFDVTDVQVTEAVEETRVEVTWAMAQREDEVLGDETTVHPSRPLGPAKQLFVSPAETRISPVLFDFASRDETEVTLRWPEGWAVETLPRDVEVANEIGVFKTRLEVDAAGRRATYHRRLEVKDRQYDKNLYASLQSLFGQAEKSDAQGLVLIRR